MRSRQGYERKTNMEKVEIVKCELEAGWMTGEPSHVVYYTYEDEYGDVCADSMRVFGCEDEDEAIDYVKAKLA